jgi:CDP-diacylglycerol--glycerol-3-phosphate 3-phosphatidyltransferase
MIARDVIVDALRMYASSQKKVIPANMFGKLKTIFQMLAIMIIFFIFNGTNTSKCLNYYFYQNLLMYVALITSLVSGVIYFRKYGKR